MLPAVISRGRFSCFICCIAVLMNAVNAAAAGFFTPFADYSADNVDDKRNAEEPRADIESNAPPIKRRIERYQNRLRSNAQKYAVAAKHKS